MKNRESSETNKNSRRTFLKTTSLAAAATAGLSTGTTRVLAEETHQPKETPPFLNVKNFGAAGDGSADDTEAFRNALAQSKENGGGTVFVPAGIYMLSGTLYLPSKVALTGAGRDATILRAFEDTLFSRYRPDPRTQEIRQRRTLITTESVGSVREPVTRDITVSHMTLDWNHCPTRRYGHSVVLADSCDHAVIDDVAFVNCLPSDHPRDINQMGGSAFRCECVMYSNARQGLMNRCSLTDSGYRPLSVSYNSKQIYFVNGKITATNPVWRHVFSENHGDLMPRDETFERSQLILLNSTFVLEGGTGQDGICSHTGTTHVENCDFYINGGLDHFHTLLRPFDGSRDCQYINNRFHSNVPMDKSNPVALLNNTSSGARGDSENITFAGNIIRLSYTGLSADDIDPEDMYNSRACLVNLPGRSKDRNIRITGNHAMLRFKGNAPVRLFVLNDAQGLQLGDNSIHIQSEPGENGESVSLLPDAIFATDCRGCQIRHNTIRGDYRHGIRLEETCERMVITGNDVSEASDEPMSGAESDDNRRIAASDNIA